MGAGGRWQGARRGRGSGGQEGQKAEEGVDGRVQEGQMAVARGGGDRKRVTGTGVPDGDSQGLDWG